MVKVLIVDDSSFMRALLKKILADIGHKETYEASGGKQAIEVFKKEKPDLTLLDIILPDIDGEKVLEAITKTKTKSKIIMVTAVGQKQMMERCTKMGAKSYIVKPFDEKKITATVKKVMK